MFLAELDFKYITANNLPDLQKKLLKFKLAQFMNYNYIKDIEVFLITNRIHYDILLELFFNKCHEGNFIHTTIYNLWEINHA